MGDTGTREVVERGRALRLACRTGCIAAIDTALRHGESISAAPVASVPARYKLAAFVVGGGTGITEANGGGPRATGGAVIVNVSTLQLAAKGRQVDTFSHLVSLVARLDEPSTSFGSIRSLIRLVTQGPDATALLRLFPGNGAHLARQLSQEIRDEALFALLQACTPSRSPLAPSFAEYVELARALLDSWSEPRPPPRLQTPFYIDLVRCRAHALARPYTLRFLLDRGASFEGPPPYPDPESGLSHITRSALARSGRYWLGQPRLDPIRDLLEEWGVGRLASPAFASALELLVGHPSRRGGVHNVADALGKYDYCAISPSSSSPWSSPDTAPTKQSDDAVVGAWRRFLSATAGLLTPHELSEFLHAYVVRKGTCPRYSRLWLRGGPDHPSGEDAIGDLAMATVAVLLAAGADVNHRRCQAPSGRYYEIQRGYGGSRYGDDAAALHAICLWLAGRASEEYGEVEGWRPSCRGSRHTRRRIWFIRYLVERCGADTSVKYLGWTPAQMLVRLRRTEVDAGETVTHCQRR